MTDVISFLLLTTKTKLVLHPCYDYFKVLPKKECWRITIIGQQSDQKIRFDDLNKKNIY